MKPTPDLAGFVEAQRRHRLQSGIRVTLLSEPSITFPPGTPLDPETGQAFDPVITGASAQASSSILAHIARRPLIRSGGDGEDATAAGLFDSDHCILITNLETSATAASATSFAVNDQTYKIVAMRHDRGSSCGDRFLIFGKAVV